MDIWFFKDGERVEVGDLVAEIAMDTVDRESKAEHSGVLRVLVAEEEAVMQGTVVDRIGRKAQSACWDARADSTAGNGVLTLFGSWESFVMQGAIVAAAAPVRGRPGINREGVPVRILLVEAIPA